MNYDEACDEIRPPFPDVVMITFSQMRSEPVASEFQIAARPPLRCMMPSL